MFIIGMALVSLGYAMFYWGLDNALSWTSSQKTQTGASSLSNGTAAVEFPILLALPYTEKDSKTVLLGLHEVPFPYHPTTSQGSARPVSTPPSGGTPATTPTNQNPIRQV